ncbi:TetR/AcrR family transcriptional regulator [Rhodococcus opacus]|uniref:TetR/AcrR family transcriptional regulator n=1 Tax=Rhodococcus opacus TaxID=37919 RepID=UPI00155A65B4|nr:TetR/AcrR family transcriptional regulator [Rhodococcus opacus]
MSPPSQNIAGRRTQSERKEESRAKLIDAAIELLGTNGYAGTTLVEIGRRAGLSRGLVTFHFGTKEQIMISVVTAIRERVQSTLVGDTYRGLDAIDQLVDNYLLGDANSGGSIRAMYVIIMESVTSSPGLRPAVAENNAVFRNLVIGWIAEAIEDRQIASHSDPHALSIVIEGVLRGTLIQYLVDPPVVELPRIAALVKRMIRQHLGAVPN